MVDGVVWRKVVTGWHNKIGLSPELLTNFGFSISKMKKDTNNHDHQIFEGAKVDGQGTSMIIPEVTNESPRDIAWQYFHALSERNLEKVLTLFADELDWYIPGNEVAAPWLGTRTSRSTVKDFFILLWQQTEAVSGTISHLAVDGNVVITSGCFSTRMLQTNKIFESLFFTEITIVGGLIVKYRLLEDTSGLVKALER